MSLKSKIDSTMMPPKHLAHYSCFSTEHEITGMAAGLTCIPASTALHGYRDCQRFGNDASVHIKRREMQGQALHQVVECAVEFLSMPIHFRLTTAHVPHSRRGQIIWHVQVCPHATRRQIPCVHTNGNLHARMHTDLSSTWLCASSWDSDVASCFAPFL